MGRAADGAFEEELSDRGKDHEAHELPEGSDVKGFATAAVSRHPDA